MRCRGDPEFERIQGEMRDTASLHPIPQRFVQSLGHVTNEDCQRDPSWRFAPIAVMSVRERDKINCVQLERFVILGPSTGSMEAATSGWF